MAFAEHKETSHIWFARRVSTTVFYLYLQSDFLVSPGHADTLTGVEAYVNGAWRPCIASAANGALMIGCLCTTPGLVLGTPIRVRSPVADWTTLTYGTVGSWDGEISVTA